MSTPLLIPLQQTPNSTRELLPVLPEAVQRGAFVVCCAGVFGGRHYDAGDVVVCRGRAVHGDGVVLVARGHGRPRLGTVDGLSFRGDAGEPCHAERWQAAGRLVAVYRRTAQGWLVDLVGPAPAVEEAPAQLSLFAGERRAA